VRVAVKYERACFQNNGIRYARRKVDLVFQRFTGAVLYADSMNAKHPVLFPPFITYRARARTDLYSTTRMHRWCILRHLCHSGDNFNPWKAISSACIRYVKQIKKDFPFNIARRTQNGRAAVYVMLLPKDNGSKRLSVLREEA